jgi:bifunctional DNase/RNase
MAKKSKKLKELQLPIIIAIFAIVIVCAALNIWILLKVKTQIAISQPVIIPEGYLQASVDISGNIVSLTSQCEQITATVADAQAEAIKTGLENITSYRPLTHDIMRDILEFFDIKLLAVRIDKMENMTYFGRLLLQQGERGLSLDVRPSDGIALALRTGSPIFVNQSLFEKYGKKIC